MPLLTPNQPCIPHNSVPRLLHHALSFSSPPKPYLETTQPLPSPSPPLFNMVLPNRSIESFFPKTQVPPASYAVPGSGTLLQPADGLAPSNAGVGLQPETEVWHPKGVYEQVNISDLQPGLCKVTFKGRIVNSSLSPETNPGSKISMLPKGYHFLVIKDDTGLVAVCAPSLPNLPNLN